MTTSKNDTRHRHAREDDVEWIVATSMREVPKLPAYRDIPMEYETTKAFIHSCLDRPESYAVSVLCDSHTDKPVGVGICYCVPIVFTVKGKAAQDVFLYIDPEWRSLKNVAKMYSNYKKWANEMGAILTDASFTSGYESAAMDMLLRRNGFYKIGATYRARMT